LTTKPVLLRIGHVVFSQSFTEEVSCGNKWAYLLFELYVLFILFFLQTKNKFNIDTEKYCIL